MLIDLRNKNITGKQAENALVKADITLNKNMVPFDTQSPYNLRYKNRYSRLPLEELKNTI